MNSEIIAYSYLATLNNMNKHKDYLKLYKDIIINTIFELSHLSKEFLINDVRLELIKTYSIDIPEAIIEKIIRTYISDSEVLVTSDGAIFLKNVFLDDFIENIKSASSDIAYLEENFQQYLINNSVSETYSIYDLIELYKLEILNLSVTETENLQQYKYHLNYLKIIEKDKSLKSIFSRIIWGAILTSCIMNGKNMNGSFKGHVLLLDTSFIISLLGLHTELSNRTCNQVIEISKELGFEYRIFDQTISEAKNLILDTAEKIKEGNNISSIFDNDITRACYFNHKKSPTDLERIADSITILLSNKFEYKIEFIEKLKTRVENSSLYKSYIEVQKKDKISAYHDTAAIMYVENCRNGKHSKVENAKCWFVQDRKNRSNSIRNNHGMVNERISSHDLLLLLWINKPSIMDYTTVSSIEFLKISSLAVKLDKKTVSQLKKFEDNIKKYSIEKITPEENARLMRKIANMTMEEIEEINVPDSRVFNDNIRKIIQEQEENELELVSSYESELMQKENMIIEKHEQVDYYKHKNEENEHLVNKAIMDIENEKGKAEKLRTELVKEKDGKTDQIKKKKLILESLELVVQTIEQKTEKLSIDLEKFNVLLFLLVLLYIIYLLIFQYNSWNYIEPIISIFTLICLLINFVIRLFNKSKKSNIPNFIEFITSQYNKYLMRKQNKPLEAIESLNAEVLSLEGRINELESLLNN